MDVPGAFGGSVESIGTKDLAVGGDDQRVVVGELVAEFGDPGRLTKGEIVREGEFGDGGYCRPASSTPTRVGLRDNEPYLVGGGEQACQDGRRELGGTCEGYLRGDLSALLGEEVLPPLAHGRLARLPIGAVEDQDAVEVVDLVLEDPGEQVGGFDLQRLARDVLARDGNGCRAFDVDQDPRYREASFRYFLGCLRRMCEDGVDDNVLFVFHGGDEHPPEASDLVGGQADALVVTHGGQHVLGEAHQGLVEALDRCGAGLEHRVSERLDVERHLYLLGIHVNANLEPVRAGRYPGGQGRRVGHGGPSPGPEQDPPRGVISCAPE